MIVVCVKLVNSWFLVICLKEILCFLNIFDFKRKVLGISFQPSTNIETLRLDYGKNIKMGMGRKEGS